MKVLLDTNVLIAAFITRGVCGDLLEHCLRQRELVTPEWILNEFQENLVRKFHISPSEATAAVELLREKVTSVTLAMLEQAVCRDPDDDLVVGTAIAGNVACLVTGDKGLLMLKQFGSIDILSPSEFPAYEATRSER